MATYKLTLQEIPDEWDIGKQETTVEGDNLSAVMVRVLEAAVHNRKCQLVASVVRGLYEGTGEEHEFFLGYNAAMEKLVEAACAITDGWEEHDEWLIEEVRRMKNKEPEKQK